jgi:hypothetical protein
MPSFAMALGLYLALVASVFIAYFVFHITRKFGALLFHGWRKLKQRNSDGKLGKLEKYEVRETVISLEMLEYSDLPECLR